MKKKRAPALQLAGDRLDAIKQTAITAMFADDELMDVLVLKGGNAMDLIHRVNARASVDLDFSIAADLDVPATLPRVERALRSTFDLEGLYAFDIKMNVRPGQMPNELASFWGGYLVEFKLIALQRAREAAFDLETLRREAIRLGEGTRFTIDISRHEYVADREAHDLNGYRIYVYSPEMIVCEKLRAICQQMPEYGPLILRSGGGHQRARDFVDITALIEHFQLDVTWRAGASHAAPDVRHEARALVFAGAGRHYARTARARL